MASIVEHIGIHSLTDGEMENLMRPAVLEDVEDQVLDGIHRMVHDIVLDAADRVRQDQE